MTNYDFKSKPVNTLNLSKLFGRKPKPKKELVPKTCTKCKITYIPRYNGNSKYCLDCKVAVWAERANRQGKSRNSCCVKCQKKGGYKIVTENAEGKEEKWCKPCYQAALAS